MPFFDGPKAPGACFPAKSDMSAPNLTRQTGQITEKDRQTLLGQQGVVVWLTGLSGAGKSTLGFALEKALVDRGRLAFVLDGDNVRHGLCQDLGFGPDDRAENVRRVGEVAALMAQAGVIAIACFISPYRADRDRARAMVPKGRFFEVHLNTPVEVCEARDPKGLYRKARAGQIPEFTGVSAPYEAPETPEISVATGDCSVQDGVQTVLAHLDAAGVFV